MSIVTAEYTTEHQDSFSDYTALRESVGLRTVTGPLVRLRGDDRLAVLDALLSKGSDYVEPETTREALALNADGTPLAIFVHLELDEECWLVPTTPLTAAQLRRHLAGVDIPAGATVEIDPEGWTATAVEGPIAWQVAADFVDFDISGLVLHQVTEVTIDGADQSYLAREGTTGEYGYLLLSSHPTAGEQRMLSGVLAAGGQIVGSDALARARAEAGMPQYSAGFLSLPIAEGDLSWLIDWNRIGEFVGSDHLVAPALGDSRLTAVIAPPGTDLTGAVEVLDAGEVIGEFVWTAPSANPTEELAFAELQHPFGVPGLALTARCADGSEFAIRTATLPRLVTRSATERIG